MRRSSTRMVQTLVVTGASGFLGQALTGVARARWPGAGLVALNSPRWGGIDLAKSNASEELKAAVHIPNPSQAALIHTAALVRWDTPDGFLENAAMSLNVAMWARSIDIGFCVLVSGVNVYASLPLVDVHTVCGPATFYGLGKLAAEHVWRLILPQTRSAIVRLAGIWGWQMRPTLFWNRLLLAAARGTPPEAQPIVRRSRSRRNYISAREASECLLQVASNRMAGLFLCAGRDIVDTEDFVKAVKKLPGTKLCVDWQDDGGEDNIIYRPSAELLGWLRSFPDELSATWASKPSWISQDS